MRIILLILTLIVGLHLQAEAQLNKLENRWGKGAYISAPSTTLDGVKPLADWIWDSGAQNPENYYLLVRKTFTLDSLPKTAKAYISAYAYADVYINGKLLERCPMNCDPQYQCYDYFDIATYLHKGSNCISAVVQNFGVGLHSQMNARGGFFFQAKLSFAGGRSDNILTDKSWKVIQASSWNTQSPLREPNAHLIGFVEEFDARLWPDGWQNSNFNDTGWESAKVIGVPPVSPWNSLVVTERPKLDRALVKPVRSWRIGKVMVYDFGVEIVGYPRFTIESAKDGIQFEVGTGERLDANRVPVIRSSGDHSNKYTTKIGVQSWQPYSWQGFRYFSMEVNPDIQIKEVIAESSCYHYELDSSFECSDRQLNSFWRIGQHTMRINSIDVYEDPWREHTQYIAGDSRYMQIYGNYAFGKSARFLSAYNLICGAESQRWRADGAVRSRYPTDYFLQPGSSAYLADYQLEWVLMIHEYFMYYGEDKLIEELYPNMKRAIDYFQAYVDPKTGLLANLPGWIVLDWPNTYQMEMKSIITGTNCEYYGALNAAADVASHFAHDSNQAKIWRDQAAQLKQNINTELWSENSQAYLDSYGGTKTGQQPQVYALIYGVPDENRKLAMTDLVMQRGKQSEESFAYWVLNSMFNENKSQWALDYMRKNWGDQTRLDSFNGTWQEGWNLPWGSTSHSWSSGPTALLPQKVLGLEPTDYGWKTFQIKPHVGDLKWAKGSVSTVAGEVSAGWQKMDRNHFKLQLTVPKGTTARVYLPTTERSTVKIDGKALVETPLVKAQVLSGTLVVLQVGPGLHHFECDGSGE